MQTYRQDLEQLVEARTAELKASDDHLRQEISGRQRADQAVRTSEQQYRLLAENVADGIGILQEGKLVFVNDALASMFGYPAHTLMEMDVGELVREEDQASFRKRLEGRDHDADYTRVARRVCEPEMGVRSGQNSVRGRSSGRGSRPSWRP